MIEQQPQAFSDPVDEFADVLAGKLEASCFDLRNKYGNPKYRFNVESVNETGEVARLHVVSICQYAPEGDIGDTGEWDAAGGSADFHYAAGEGDHGEGEIVVRRVADGTFSIELTGNLEDQDAIRNMLPGTLQ